MSKDLNYLFKEFTTEEDAKKWAKENYGQWLNKGVGIFFIYEELIRYEPKNSVGFKERFI